MSLTLSSAAFAPKARIPPVHTCDGANTSPPLAWSGAPAETRSFALVCTDPDAPVGTWYHWAVFDIPADIDTLIAGLATDARVGAIRQAVNDFKRTGYGGPCPPRGHGVHHYHFRLLALAVPHLDVADRADCREIERAAATHVLAEAELIGTYAR
jgi:hypothetical protein